MDWITRQNVIVLALLGTLFTWAVTALGASLIFVFKKISKRSLDAMLGFAAGVMIAASCWSLLIPSISMSESLGIWKWVPAVVGFLLGGVFIYAIDKVLPHLHSGFSTKEAEGIPSSWRRSILLVSAITLHNLPEGLAIGVAFGAAAAVGGVYDHTLLMEAIALTIGIGLQNFPEGTAVSVPLRREGLSRRKSFFYGQASGFVEPIGGVFGAWLVITLTPILPYALAFAAGAMIYVVVEELIPESRFSKHGDVATIGTMLGFAVMMMLDVALS